MPAFDPTRFFSRDVTEIARDLLGAEFYLDGVGGRIAETEAYHPNEAASHAHRGRTERNAAMFLGPGHVYVYRSYGIHWCLNFVCADASAILIRALEPLAGIEKMAERRGLAGTRELCSGPGKLAQALAVTKAHDGLRIDAPPFQFRLPDSPFPVVIGPRIGISKAADLPWRFGIAGSPFLSKAFRPG